MINHAVIVLGGQQSDSAIHIHVSILPQTSLPSRLPHNIKESFVCYTLGPGWLTGIIFEKGILCWESIEQWRGQKAERERWREEGSVLNESRSMWFSSLPPLTSSDNTGNAYFKSIFHYSNKLLDKIFTPSSFSFNAYLLEVTLIKPFPNQLTREAHISAQSVNCSPSEPSF